MFANLNRMLESAVQERSERLADLVDGLASALYAGGVAEDAAARLLAHASTAVLQALTLELLLAAPEAVPAEPAEHREASLPLAA